jgi:hypothetical protein
VGSIGQVDAPESSKWDCAIGELNFLFGTSDQYPFRRETAEFRRQRIDTERNPGEQSLDSGYWIRSQASWHYGSGLTSAEPLEVNNNEAQFRYKEGGGVNPWVAGQLTLLKDTGQALADAGTGQLLLGVDTGVLHASSTTMTYIPSASGASASAVTWGGSASAITSITSDGQNYYAANAVGIYKGSLPTGAGSLLWDTGSRTVVRWVKSRLMATVGNGIFELTGTGPSLPTALDAGGARPANWTWTDIAEGPAGIYFAGHVGDTSTIEKVSVSTSASAVTLDQPVVVADMPRGEIVQSLYAYVGTYLVIGTSRGVRVALINSDGSLTMGPLVVESSDGVLDIVAQGSFLFVTVGSKGNAGDRQQRAGLFRIDLGQNLNGSPLDFAHAADLTAPAGTPGAAVQVTLAGGQLWFAVDGAGVYRELGTFVPQGWLETGRIRLGTVEKKGWRDLRLLTDPGIGGQVVAHASTDDEGSPSQWNVVITANGTRFDATGKLTAVAPSPQSNLFVGLQLQSNEACSCSARLIGYQVRAVPAPERTRLLQVPLLVFDFTTDRTGMRLGKKGYAWDTISKLQELEESAAVVQWRDFTTGEAATAYIERVALTRLSPPSRNQSGAGGIATVLLRLV